MFQNFATIASNLNTKTELSNLIDAVKAQIAKMEIGLVYDCGDAHEKTFLAQLAEGSDVDKARSNAMEFMLAFTDKCI